MLDFLRKEFQSIGPNLDVRIDIPFDYDALINNREYLESLKTYLTVFDYYKVEALHSLKATEELNRQIENYIDES